MLICDDVFAVLTCYYDMIIINVLADKPTNKESESESVCFLSGELAQI